MRAYKTVNDSYIEPISFTVPRRAETFQSDIYPPAVGLKPAVSSKEWLSGKTGVPAKIDLESVYDGNAPVEVPSDYKPPATTTASAPAPAPASPVKAAPKKEPEPAPAPVRSGPPPSINDQKQSISSMANKFQDDEEESSDDDDAESTSFEETGRPQPRNIAVAAAAPASAAKSPVSPYKPPQAASQVTSPPPPAAAASAVASKASTPAVSRTSTFSPVAAATSSSANVNGSSDIADALAKLTTLVQAQNSKIDSLTSEVEGLKKRLLLSSEQSERIRQLELELEEARS